MCDYSLHACTVREAEIDDVLETTTFPYTSTRGLRLVGDDERCATCLKPGTELAFERDEVKVDRVGLFWFLMGDWRTFKPGTVKFTQTNLSEENMHHDAIEFADGRIVTLNRLAPGQRVRVLQLPAVPISVSDRDTDFVLAPDEELVA